MIKKDLTKGRPITQILLLAVPTMISMLLQFSYSLVDTFYLGMVGDYAISGIGTATLIINFAIALNFMAIVGTGVKVSHSAGDDDVLLYKKYLNSGTIVNLVLGIFSFFVLFVFGDMLIGSFKLSNPMVVDAGSDYLKVYSINLIFSFFNLFYSRILNSLGQNKKVMYVNLFGIGLNMILDPIFILRFGMGAKGVAVATLIANALVTLIFLTKFSESLKFDKKVSVEFIKIKEIISVGTPYSMQRVFFTLVGYITGRWLVNFSEDAIAAQKVGFQIESLTLLVIAGLLSAMTSFSGQNFGAKEYDRIKKGYNSALFVGIAYAAVTSTIFFIFSEAIIGLFLDSQEGVYYGALYLKMIAIGQTFAVLEMVSNGMYSGLGLTKIPSYISISITFLRIPLYALLSARYGVEGIFLSVVITTVLKGLISYGYYLLVIKKKIGTVIVYQK